MSKQDKSVYLFLSIFFLVTALLAYLSTGTYESGDSIQHYLIAKYSFKHPALFFDHWGKPVFTLLASTFAQFGFLGICLFNISCATVTGLLAYKIACRLSIRNAWIAPVFALFAPIYYVTLISGLTEPLFGFVLLTAIYFCLDKRFTASAVIISFLPFVRSEGFLLLPIFAITFVMQRKYMHCVLLLTGTVLYSFVGFFHYHNLLWIWTENPYKGAKDIYGSGNLFHFLDKNEFILGTPLVVLFCIGIVCYFFRRNKIAVVELLLIPGIVATYFIAHSFFWWKGLYGSLGLIRVMAGVVPLAGLVALGGFNTLSDFLLRNSTINKFSILKPIFGIIVIALIIWMPFKQHSFPRPLDYEDAIVKETAEWIRQNYPGDHNYYYQYPYLSVFMNVDPFDNSYTPLWSMHPDNITSGSFIIWDSHFGPNEAKQPLSNFTKNPEFELLHVFKADSTKVPRDKPVFETFIFKKK